MLNWLQVGRGRLARLRWCTTSRRLKGIARAPTLSYLESIRKRPAAHPLEPVYRTGEGVVDRQPQIPLGTSGSNQPERYRVLGVLDGRRGSAGALFVLVRREHHLKQVLLTQLAAGLAKGLSLSKGASSLANGHAVHWAVRV